MLDHRGQLLRAALGFAGLPRPSYDLPLHALRSWLDSWAGIGHVAVGMHRQGYDLHLTRCPIAYGTGFSLSAVAGRGRYILTIP